jgi:hypothetical protein
MTELGVATFGVLIGLAIGAALVMILGFDVSKVSLRQAREQCHDRIESLNVTPYEVTVKCSSSNPYTVKVKNYAR